MKFLAVVIAIGVIDFGFDLADSSFDISLWTRTFNDCCFVFRDHNFLCTTKQIAENAGMEGGVVVEKVKSMKGNEGFNAANGEYTDLVKLGVIDAAKVTRSALQNAASIAALFLTTEAVIADKPEESGPAMPGGGMDDY